MPTGILNLAPQDKQVATYSATQAQAKSPTSVGYKPNEFNVAQNQTVAGQLDSVIANDSPLLQQAKRRATVTSNQAMNDRGLLNSSLAVGAGIEAADNALYERALPIAQQDAQTHRDAATNTTNAQNAALYAKMQADNAASMRDAELQTNVNLSNADAATKADAATSGAANQFKQIGLETNRAYTLADKEFERVMATAQLEADTRINLAGIDRDTRVELTTIENNYRQLLQTNQDLSAMYNQVSTNISNIAASNLSQEAKNSATQTQLNLLKQALAAKQNVTGTPATPGTSGSGPTAPNVSNMNISSYFNGGIAETKPDQTGYNLALQRWREQQAEHQAIYGTPIPTSAYKDGYRPPRKSDFGLSG